MGKTDTLPHITKLIVFGGRHSANNYMDAKLHSLLSEKKKKTLHFHINSVKRYKYYGSYFRAKKKKAQNQGIFKAGTALRNHFLKLLMQMELKNFLKMTGVIGIDAKIRFLFEFSFHTA